MRVVLTGLYILKFSNFSIYYLANNSVFSSYLSLVDAVKHYKNKMRKTFNMHRDFKSKLALVKTSGNIKKYGAAASLHVQHQFFGTWDVNQPN